MPLSKSDAKALDYEGFQITDADLTSGADDTESLSAGEVGELATAEVGNDGALSNYQAVKLATTALSEISEAMKGFIDIENDSDSDIDDRTQIRWGVKKKGERGSEIKLTSWKSVRTLDNSDPRQREPIPVKDSLATDSRLLVLEIKNEATSITPNLGNCVIEQPALGGK